MVQVINPYIQWALDNGMTSFPLRGAAQTGEASSYS